MVVSKIENVCVDLIQLSSFCYPNGFVVNMFFTLTRKKSVYLLSIDQKSKHTVAEQRKERERVCVCMSMASGDSWMRAQYFSFNIVVTHNLVTVYVEWGALVCMYILLFDRNDRKCGAEMAPGLVIHTRTHTHPNGMHVTRNVLSSSNPRNVSNVKLLHLPFFLPSFSKSFTDANTHPALVIE